MYSENHLSRRRRMMKDLEDWLTNGFLQPKHLIKRKEK